MSDDSQQPIIVKRVKKGGGGAHGGAWKIAYADFVTAMMAFFLLMWLLGSVTSGDLKGIADYFNAPMKVAMPGGSGSGDSSSIVTGGGDDLTRSFGQVRQGDIERKKTVASLQALPVSRAAFEKMEAEKLAAMKAKIEEMIEKTPSLKQFKNQLLIDITSEGLRIQIVDEKNRPMFDLASATLKPYTREILYEIGKFLNTVENRIGLSGHTDATPFSSGEKGYGNWELSTDRANASRRELLYAGMQEEKLLRVVGLASAVPFDRDDPFNAVNRRITIVIMNKRTEEAILRDGKFSEIDANDPVQVAPPALVPGAAAPVATPGSAGH